MSNKLKTILKQAELYRSQGLLIEAKKKYEIVQAFIQKNNVKNKENLLAGIKKKIESLNIDVASVEQAPTTPEMSNHVNDLIKKLFSFSNDSDSVEDSALEGAIALAKFGQFDGAISEFKKLLANETLKVAAAKNILRCYIALENTADVFAQYKDLKTGGIFSSEQLEQIETFYDDLLEKKGIQREVEADETEELDIAAVENSSVVEAADDDDDDEFLDISAVAITLNSGPSKGEQYELDVSFQSGNIISLIVSSKDETLIENLKIGVKLDDVHFYSPIAIFRGSGIVSAKTLIKSGPKQGDYSLDIKIDSI